MVRAVPDCIGNWLLLFVLRFKELSINDISATPFCETIQRESVCTLKSADVSGYF